MPAREADAAALRLDPRMPCATPARGSRSQLAVDLLRAQLATRLAQRERDPESTSQIIRELRARRSVEPAEVRRRASRRVAADRLTGPPGPALHGASGPERTHVISVARRAGLAIAAVLALGGGLTACASATAAGASLRPVAETQHGRRRRQHRERARGEPRAVRVDAARGRRARATAA